MNFRLALLLLAVAAACGSDEIMRIGAACSDSDPCDISPTSACIRRWPAGYCTEYDCQVGSCPSGALCVRGVTFPDVPVNSFCFATCESDADCREGYRCTDVSEPEKVCAPINP